jgi:hypothetical protein
MASGPNFQDELNPRAAVQIGREGDVGIIEIQDLMFTVSGPTAGAIVVQWNVHESYQGSVGMWGTYHTVSYRVWNLTDHGQRYPHSSWRWLRLVTSVKPMP